MHTDHKEIEIYVHNAHQRDPQLIRISEAATIEELLQRVAPHEHAEMVLIVEDEDQPRERHHRLHEGNIHHRHHVHVHHCREVEVRVSYNGITHEHKYAPAKTVEKVLHWALGAFSLKGADAMNKVLRLAHGSDDPLPETAHVGSFVAKGHCVLLLNLTVKRNVNG